MNEEQFRIQLFLFHEARLLDTQQLEAWLELFTEDATYWVPLEHGQQVPTSVVAGEGVGCVQVDL